MTGQAGKVARGLRTIGANITQLAQEAQTFEIQVNGVTKSVNLWNEAGTDMLDTYKVLQQISKYWEDMTNAERSSLAITLAKKTQMDTFLATMSNFEDAEKAYTTALLSEGSAWKENEAYMESIEAHQSKMKAQWEQLILSAPIEDLEKALLDAGTALLEFANSKVGQAIIKLTTLVTVMALLNKAFSALQTLLISKNATNVFLSGIISLITGETTLLQTTIALTTAMAANPLFWGVAAVASIYAIYKAVDYLSSAFERNLKQISELNEVYKTAKQEVNNLENKLKELNKTIEDIEAQKLEIVDEDELKKLNQATEELSRQEAVLKYQLQLAKSKADEAEREARAKAQTFKTTEQKVTIYTYNDQGGLQGTGGVTPTTFEGTPQEVFEKELDGLESIEKQIESNKKTIEELSVDYETNKDVVEELEKQNSDLANIYNQVEKETNDTASGLLSLVELGLDADKSIQGLLDRFGKVSTEAKKVVDGIDEITDSEEEAKETTEEVADAITQFLKVVDDYQSAYETLNKAAEEYNENGYISASTLKKLAKLDSEYQAQLEITNGIMTVTNGALQDQFNLSKQLAIIHAKTETETEALAYAQGYLADNIVAVGNDSNKSQPKVSELSQAFTDLGHATQEANKGIWAVRNALGDEEALEKFNKGLEEIYNRGAKRVENLEGIELDYVSSSKSSASSHKDAWVEAFEEEQRQLKHSLEMNEITEIEYYEKLKALNEKYFGEASGNHQKYLKEYQENEEEIYKGMKSIYDKVKDYLKEAVESGYEKAINALKKEEKKVLEEIKEQLEALKKEKKKVLDNIKDEINGLKKQKEAVQKYYNDQIDAIKRENEVLQEQNELLEYQQALQQAKAQKVMVFQDGKFQLGENESAVAQAEQNLAQYQDQISYEQQIQQLEDLRDAQVESIEARIESLEEYYDYMEDYYDKQIESMEEYYNQVQEQYEKQIEALQTELDAFKEGYQKQEDLENARLAAQALGINERALLYEQDLENLKNYINATNTMLASLGEAGVIVGHDYSPATASHENISMIGGVETSVQRRASGDASFRGDEIALVGESPNTELVLGSRLNHSLGGGSLVNLSKGSGVVNAESTSTLAGLLNGLASPIASNTSRTVQQNFTFGSISLPSVTDANSFVKTLSSQFNNYAIQYSTMKK